MEGKINAAMQFIAKRSCNVYRNLFIEYRRRVYRFNIPEWVFEKFIDCCKYNLNGWYCWRLICYYLNYLLFYFKALVAYVPLVEMVKELGDDPDNVEVLRAKYSMDNVHL